MKTDSLHAVLSAVVPSTSEGADALLDLREQLMSEGHPGTCVKCFFALLGDLGKPGALKPLRHWLEERLEVEVTADGRELETLPLRLEAGENLESFCRSAIATVRHDRTYRDRRISMRLRYKQPV